MQMPKARIAWDTFDILNYPMLFKLDYIVPEKHGEESIIGIDLEDIESELAIEIMRWCVCSGCKPSIQCNQWIHPKNLVEQDGDAEKWSHNSKV